MNHTSNNIVNNHSMLESNTRSLFRWFLVRRFKAKLLKNSSSVLNFKVLPTFVILISSSLEEANTGVRRRKRMLKQEEMMKVPLQIWQGLLDHFFSLLHQDEHSPNDTDSWERERERGEGRRGRKREREGRAKGCVFQILELSGIC